MDQEGPVAAPHAASPRVSLLSGRIKKQRNRILENLPKNLHVMDNRDRFSNMILAPLLRFK
jgi:hypothetical protein